MERFPDNTAGEITALGFDFGLRRIGVAFGHSLTGRARPLPVLKARDGVPDWTRMEQLVSEWQPDLFVVGMPWHMDDSESEMLQRARKFANRLHGRLHKPCYGIDERLSSVDAREHLRDGRARGELDSTAAVLILETWFSALADRDL